MSGNLVLAAPETGSPETQTTLAGYIRAFLEINDTAHLTELDHAGRTNTRSYGDMRVVSERLRRQLPVHGRPGQAQVVLCFESPLDYLPAAWAAILSGYTCLPWQIPRRLLDKDFSARLAFLANKLESPFIVTTSKLKDRIERLEGWQSGILCTDQVPADRMVPSAHDGSAAAAADEQDAGSDDGAFLLCTSGSTGDPKIAIVSYPCALAREQRLHRYRKPGKNARTAPFDTITGLATIVPRADAPLFIQPEFIAAKPTGLLTVATEFELTSIATTTTEAARLCDALEGSAETFDLSSVRAITFGRERIVPAVVVKLFESLRRFGLDTRKVSFGYGTTETGLIAWTTDLTVDKLLATQEDLTAPPALGPVREGWTLRLVDDDCSPVPDGTAGNIELFSDRYLFSGYLDDAEANNAAFTPDGWFRSGDMGELRDGQLVISGRKKSTMIVAGKNIALEPMEGAAVAMGCVSNGLIAAMPVRRKQSTTDELALFFVPRPDRDIRSICNDLKREIARRWGVSVSHFVPLTDEQFPLTRNGKVERATLVAGFQSGELRKLRLGGKRRKKKQAKRNRVQRLIHKAYRKLAKRLLQSAVSRPPGKAVPPQRTPAPQAPPEPSLENESLPELWQRILKLDRKPAADANFYDLGGDSLLSAGLIFEVEEKYGRQLPLEQFFEEPTIARMETLLGSPVEAARAPSGDLEETGGVLRKLRVHTAGWPGDRPFVGSLVMGFNTTGARPPIFWVLQEPKEARALAAHLGTDQPLYVMRSLVGLETRYSESVLEAVGNRYLYDMLATIPGGPFMLGGNCQGGIIALTLARRLTQIGRPPEMLALLEWAFSKGRYDGRTLLIYGASSRSAKIYEEPETAAIDWRADFPAHEVESIAVSHGNFFVEENTPLLCGLLREKADQAWPLPHTLSEDIRARG